MQTFLVYTPKLFYLSYKDLLKIIMESQEPMAHTWILATQEAETRRIKVWNQLRQTGRETLSWKKPITKKGWWSGSRCRPWVQTPVLPKKIMESQVWCITPVTPTTQGAKAGGLWVWGQPGLHRDRPCPKKQETKTKHHHQKNNGHIVILKKKNTKSDFVDIIV
jgi:hypothetical protein